MKKLRIIIVMLILIVMIVTIVINKNIPKYIMQDGMMLALTLDEKEITTFPERGKYSVEMDCRNTGKGIWLAEEWKLAIEDIKGNIKCHIRFKSNPITLKSEVENKATKIDVSAIIDNSVFTTDGILDETNYIISSMETTSDGNNAFIWNSDAKTWTSQNHTHYNTKGMNFTVDDGYYQMCYTMSSEQSYDYGIVYIDGVEQFNTKGKNTSSFVCENLGNLTSSNVVRVVYYKDGSGNNGNDNVVFYLQSGKEDITYIPIDVSYRYTGKQPDNWVWFNGEKWRIVGSIPTTLSDGTETNLVKIIRNDLIGLLSFDGDYSSQNTNVIWGSNSLYTLLNTKYFGKEDATGSSPCYGYGKNGYALCNYEEIGISNEINDYYGRMIKDVYWNVGIVSDLSSKIPLAYIRELETKSTVTAKIGLLNVTDYGYAISGITDKYSNTILDSLSNTSLTYNNWLYGKDEWTLTRSSTTVLCGPSIYGSSLYESRGVRPVVFLDSSVYIISGDGTEGNPYQIGM